MAIPCVSTRIAVVNSNVSELLVVVVVQLLGQEERAIWEREHRAAWERERDCMYAA